MSLDDRIREAANLAISQMGLEGVQYDVLYRHQDTERVEVHFRQGSNYFGIQILTGGHPDHPAETSVKVLTEQIITELRKR